MPKKKSKDIRNKALKIFRSKGGILRTMEAIKAGVHPRILYELRDSGVIEQLQTGLYGLIDLPDVAEPDFVTVSKKVPESVICLISALYYHRLTVEIPRWIDVAIRQKYKPPILRYPPVQFHWFSDNIFKLGIEKHDFNGASVKIYSREKTIVDCFRLRHKIGKNIAIEALKTYWTQENTNFKLLREYAKISRVLRVMEPFLEVIMNE
ncbi:MAG: hypothetical protein K1000chlam2_00437 [Chlamydiae bacterium]|nr:hypothetical protein [Chlamydiota bacterium]